MRAGPRVRHERFPGLDEALAALERQAREASGAAPPEPVDARVRRFEPAQLIAARLELAGPERWVPTVRAGIDVCGDGTMEAFVGRIRRTSIERRSGEDAVAALRRELRSRD